MCCSEEPFMTVLQRKFTKLLHWLRFQRRDTTGKVKKKKHYMHFRDDQCELEEVSDSQLA